MSQVRSEATNNVRPNADTTGTVPYYRSVLTALTNYSHR